MKFIYLATSAKCARPINLQTAVKGLDFMKRNENDEITIFVHLYVGVFLNLWCFFVESVPNRVIMPDLLKCSATKTWQVLLTKHTKTFKKPAACSHNCLLWHEHCHWGIGILAYTFKTDPGPSNPTTFLVSGALFPW